MKPIILIFIIFSSFFLVSCIINPNKNIQDNNENELENDYFYDPNYVKKEIIILDKTYPNYVDNYKLINIFDIINSNYGFDYYNIKGEVLAIYPCPLCPQGAFCSPCISESIVISDIEISDNNVLNQIRINVEDAQQFQSGEKYIFSVFIDRIINDYNPDDFLFIFDNIKLIGYNKIE
jgi:hypothetical protein